MNTTIDCLIIGYNDIDFSQHERMIMNNGKHSPEYRIFEKDNLLINGRRYPYIDVLNYFINRKAGAGTPGTAYYHIGEVPNLASVYLKSYLARQDFNCEFVSLFGVERERLAELLECTDIQAVAVTTTFYVTPKPVIDIAQFIRQHNKNVNIIIGGPLISNLSIDLDHETLEYIFQQMGGDIYVKEAQGEGTLARILGVLKKGGDLKSIPNLYLPHAGHYIFTGAELENQPLDECAINWELFSRDELGATVQTRTARSCAFKCSFCDYPIRAGALTVASIETVERELKQLADYGTKNIVFIDDTFNVPMKRFKELCKMMIKNRFGFHWFSYFRASHARDEETFDLMKESGCSAVFLGIESGDATILKHMNKIANLDQYHYGIQELHKRNIITFASFIAGFPGENAQTIDNTIQFINDTGPTFYRMEPWWYNHRSPIHQWKDKFSIEGQGYRWKHSTMNVYEACDAVDKTFKSVTRSLWMPMYNFDFWALPYLLGKGMEIEGILQFHVLAREVMSQNLLDSANNGRISPETVLSIANLEHFCNNLSLSPAKYQANAQQNTHL